MVHLPAKKVTQIWLPSHAAKQKRCANLSSPANSSSFPSSIFPKGERATAKARVSKNATIVEFCVIGSSNFGAIDSLQTASQEKVDKMICGVFMNF